MMKNFALSFLLIAFIASYFSVFSNDTVLSHFSTISEQVDINAFSHPQIAKKYISELESIADMYPENINLTAEVLYRKSSVNFYQLTDDSILLAKCKFMALALSAAQYPFESALLDYSLSMCYYTNGDFTMAFTYALKSLEQFLKTDNQLFISKLYCLLGHIFLTTRSRDEAIECYWKAISFATTEQRDYYLPYVALYSNVVYTKKYNQNEIDSLVHFLKNPERCTDKGVWVSASLNLGSIYYYLGDEQKSIEYLNLCQHYIDLYDIDNQMLKCKLIYILTKFHFDKGEYREALKCIAPAKEIAMNNNNLMQQSYILLFISDIYMKMNRVDSAYHYLWRYKEVGDKIVNNSRIIDAYKAYISVYLESLEKGLKIAAQEKKQLHIIIVFISVIFLLMVGQLLTQLQKRKRMFLQIEKDKLIKRLQDDKIESQKRELTSSVLLLSRKNELLEQIDVHVNALPQNNYDVKEIKKIVKGNLTVEEVWGTFMIHFDKVHPGFFNKLKVRAPDLTENNLRLCAYILIGMTAKQIAQVLNMSPDNVRKSSYRLKKKLLLGEEDSLPDFLKTV